MTLRPGKMVSAGNRMNGVSERVLFLYAESGVERDKELIERANRGDGEAFEQLYRRYRDWVYRLA